MDKLFRNIMSTLYHINSFQSVYLAFLLLLIATPMPVYATDSKPNLDCAVTEDNLMALVSTYDSDAYYILQTQKELGDNLNSYLNKNVRLIQSVDMTVHEEFHAYSYTHGTYTAKTKRSAYYLGNKKRVTVKQTNVFHTDLATRHIAKKYRTFRYKTYVKKGVKLTSNVDAVYGLLNEFSAYYWGMHTMESLYPYLKQESVSTSDWTSFISSYCNNKNAYAEFYYYTLVYLDYAKRQKPSVYKKIMTNKNFVTTFYTTQQQYEKLIKQYEKDLNALSKKYNGSSFKKNYKNGMFYLNGYGQGAGDDAYGILMPQIKSKKYKSIRNDLKKNAKTYSK